MPAAHWANEEKRHLTMRQNVLLLGVEKKILNTGYKYPEINGVALMYLHIFHRRACQCQRVPSQQ